MNTKQTIFTSCSLVLLLASLSVDAGWGDHAKKAEKRGMSVPSYCKAKFKKSFPRVTEQQYADAQDFLGGSFLHVHHFCLALVQIWSMERPGAASDQHKAKQIIKEIDYYYSRTPKDHPVMRDVHRAYSNAYRFTGDEMKSREHYDKSLQAYKHRRPTGNRTTGESSGGQRSTASQRTPSGALPNRYPLTASASRYVEMADKMMRLDLPGEAAELLELARKIEPNSKLIQAKLKAAKAAKAAMTTKVPN